MSHNPTSTETVRPTPCLRPRILVERRQRVRRDLTILNPTRPGYRVPLDRVSTRPPEAVEYANKNGSVASTQSPSLRLEIQKVRESHMIASLLSSLKHRIINLVASQLRWCVSHPARRCLSEILPSPIFCLRSALNSRELARQPGWCAARRGLAQLPAA